MGDSQCRNCGDTTSFPPTADYRRTWLGWCGPCYETSQRNHDFRGRGDSYREKAKVWKAHTEHNAKLKREAQERRRARG